MKLIHYPFRPSKPIALLWLMYSEKTGKGFNLGPLTTLGLLLCYLERDLMFSMFHLILANHQFVVFIVEALNYGSVSLVWFEITGVLINP